MEEKDYSHKGEIKRKCPKCGQDLEYISSCCKEFWYCKNCDEIIGDIESK